MDDILVKSYARLVAAGRRTIESVPVKFVEKVKAILEGGE